MILTVFSNGAAIGCVIPDIPFRILYFTDLNFTDSFKPIAVMLSQYFNGKEIIRELPFKSEFDWI